MELVKAYDTNTATERPSHLTCMVTGVRLPHFEVKAAQFLPQNQARGEFILASKAMFFQDK